MVIAYREQSSIESKGKLFWLDIQTTNHMAQWNLFDVVNSVILNFLLIICNFPLLFSQSKNIRMSTFITIIIT